MTPENMKHPTAEIALRLPWGWMVAVSMLEVSPYYSEGKFEILMHDETGRYLKREVQAPANCIARLTKMLRDQGDEMILKLFNHEGATKQ
jgi:hypothetical protein